MDKNLHDLDDYFKERLENYSEEPPGNVWQSVDNFLSRQEAEKYKRKYRVLLKAVACAAFLLACLLVSDVSTHHPTAAPQYTYSKEDAANAASEKNNMEAGKNYTKENLRSAHTAAASKNIASFFSRNIAGENADDENIFYTWQPGINYETVSIGKEDVYVVSNNITAEKKLNRNFSAMIYMPQSSNAKNTANEKHKTPISLKQEHSFSLIPFGSLDYMTSRLYDSYKNDGQNISDFRSREQPDMSYTLGLMLEYNVSKKLSLQTGFSIAHSFTSISPVALKAIPDNAGGYTFKLPTTYGYAEIKKPGVQIGDSVLVSSAMQHLRYNTVPLLVKFLVKPGKINMHATAGTAINFISAATTEVDYTTASSSNEKETIQKIEGINKSFVTLMAGAEVNWMMNKRFSVGINPMLRYAITPANKGTPIKTFPVSIGIGAAVHIKL